MSRKRVLVVDDEPGVRRLIRQILEKNYEVLEAQDGEEAITLVDAQKVDIVLMDMMMPKIDGFAACTRIKNNEFTRQIPVVMVTAMGYELDKKLSLDAAGADGYITKPFSSPELLMTIDALLK